jgi:hypothetical protein
MRKILSLVKNDEQLGHKARKKVFHKNEEEQCQAWNKVCKNQNWSSGQVIGLLFFIIYTTMNIFINFLLRQCHHFYKTKILRIHKSDHHGQDVGLG